MNEIFTIGYAGFKFEDFVYVLHKYNINSLIDVRSFPYSKHYSDYNLDNLKTEFKRMHIAYRNYKSEFGARQPEQKYYPQGYLDFSLFVKSKAFQSGLEKICNACEMGYKFVLMCSEKDPITCHRTIMVAREFFAKGFTVKNILQDGGFITQEEIEQRLVDMYFPDRDQMTLDKNEIPWEEMVLRSYSFQNEKIGYRLEERNEDFD